MGQPKNSDFEIGQITSSYLTRVLFCVGPTLYIFSHIIVESPSLTSHGLIFQTSPSGQISHCIVLVVHPCKKEMDLDNVRTQLSQQNHMFHTHIGCIMGIIKSNLSKRLVETAFKTQYDLQDWLIALRLLLQL